MTRHSLATLVVSSLLALPAMAQDAVKPAETPAAVAPTVEPRLAPNAPVPPAQPAPVLTETETKLRALLMRNQELTAELSKRRVDILKAHPEIGEKIAAARAENEEIRARAMELRKQASELDRQAVQATMASSERAYGEIDREFAAKSKEQADLMVELQQLRSQVTAERQKARQQKTSVTPNALEHPRLQKHLKPEAKPEAKPVAAPDGNQTEPKAEAKPAE